MNKDVYAIVYTKEKGRLKLTKEEWSGFNAHSIILHRVDGPAVEWADGQEWYIDGKLHRVGGPAREWAYEHKEWWMNGERHRIDGPAIEYADGNKSWYINNQLHRLDGPAKERYNGKKEWWIDHQSYSEEEFEQIIQEVKSFPLELRLTDPRWWVREIK